MERCDKAPMGLECIDNLGHSGECDCVKADAFHAAMQDGEDSFLWGGFKVVKNPMMPKDLIGVVGGNGDFDPAALLTAARRTGKQSMASHMLEWSKKFAQQLPQCTVLDHVGNVDPADEVGRVWDVLHDAGINGAGGVSASEGVRMLIEKLRTTQCQHDWSHDTEFPNIMQCTKCDATRSAV